MQEQVIYCIYKVNIDRWHKSIQQGHPPSHFWPYFLDAVATSSHLCITFDDRIATLLHFLVIHSRVHSYSVPVLLLIARELQVQNFISRRHYLSLQKAKTTCIQSLAVQFLNSLGQAHSIFQPEGAEGAGDTEVEEQWLLTVQIGLLTFWRLIIIYSLEYPLIWSIYSATSDCQGVEELIKGSQFVLRQAESEPRPNSREQGEISQENEKQESIPFPSGSEKQESMPLPSDKVEETNQIEQQTIKKKRTDQIKEAKEQTQTIQRSRIPELTIPKEVKPALLGTNPLITKIEKELVQLAFANSLFQNPVYAGVLSNLKDFLLYASQSFLSKPNFKMQIFGSLRSRLALKGEFDIDITYVCLTERSLSRSVAKSTLSSIKFRIQDGLNPSWVRKVILWNFPELPLPLIKVQVHEYEFERTFGIKNMDKIDITAGNDTAVINSEMISHYARNTDIHNFCILVKLWAKHSCVINKHKPMLGLSGYGIVMMTLYFLMETRQIPFLRLSQFEVSQISVGSVVPDLSGCRLQPLGKNFINFLRFYKRKGPFHSQRKVVCLLGDCMKARELFNQEVVINMYDFIDSSNPGRLSIKQEQFLFHQFETAYQTMISASSPDIRNLFEFDSYRNRDRDIF